MFATHATFRTPRAFTLIELLVVMGVIAILVSMLVPTLHKIREQVSISRVESVIGGVSMGLETYRTIHSVYPPDLYPAGTANGGAHTGFNKTSEALVFFLSGASLVYVDGASPADYPWKHRMYWDTTGTGSGRKAATIAYDFKANLLVDKDGDGAPELVDPWGKRLIYNSGGATNTAYNQLEAPKRGIGKFDIFSAGPDQKYGTDDDIRSWGRSPKLDTDYNYTTLNSSDP